MVIVPRSRWLALLPIAMFLAFLLSFRQYHAVGGTLELGVALVAVLLCLGSMGTMIVSHHVQPRLNGDSTEDGQHGTPA